MYKTTNKTICDFYNSNKEINFDDVNLFFIKCMTNLTSKKSHFCTADLENLCQGELGDKRIEKILNELYPTMEIKNDENDFLLKRENNTIIIENKVSQKI